MKNMVHGLMAVSLLTGAVILGAQTPAPAPAPVPAAVPAANPAPTLTADEVVAKHIQAIGGRDAIGQVKSISMENSLQVMGNEAPNTIVIVDGVGYKTETDFNGSKIVQCITDKGGWTVNPMAGQADPTPMSDDEYQSSRDSIYVGGGLLDYSAKGGKAELLSSDGGNYKIKLTTKGGSESTYVIDGTTYLAKSVLRKGKIQGQDVDVTTNFSDYRKTETGYLLPYTLDIDYGGQFQLSIAVKKVELNKTIDPSVFAMPKPATPAAPAQ